MACSATSKTTENPKWKVKSFSQYTLQLQSFIKRTKTLRNAMHAMPLQYRLFFFTGDGGLGQRLGHGVMG